MTWVGAFLSLLNNLVAWVPYVAAYLSGKERGNKEAVERRADDFKKALDTSRRAKAVRDRLRSDPDYARRVRDRFRDEG